VREIFHEEQLVEDVQTGVCVGRWSFFSFVSMDHNLVVRNVRGLNRRARHSAVHELVRSEKSLCPLPSGDKAECCK
jgi:hypothetical protein